MNKFNYRIMKQSDWTLAIHEVYYPGGVVTSWTENPFTIVGDTVEELREVLCQMIRGTFEPVVEKKE